MAANAQAPAPGPSVGIADMLDSVALALDMPLFEGENSTIIDAPEPVPTPTSGGMTLGELLTSGTSCEPYKTLIPQKAPTLNSIILANLNNVIIDYKLPEEAAGNSYLFAPTDEAFAKTLASLSVLNITSLTEIPEKDVMDILRLHVAGELPGSPNLINLNLSPVIFDIAAKNVTSSGSSAGIVEDLSEEECPKSKLFTIDSVFLPKSIRDAIAAATPTPAPAPTGAASSTSFGVAAILAGVVALFA